MSEPKSVLYVRVSEPEKARLRRLALDRFNGNMADAIRWLINHCSAVVALPDKPSG